MSNVFKNNGFIKINFFSNTYSNHLFLLDFSRNLHVSRNRIYHYVIISFLYYRYAFTTFTCANLFLCSLVQLFQNIKKNEIKPSLFRNLFLSSPTNDSETLKVIFVRCGERGNKKSHFNILYKLSQWRNPTVGWIF